MEGIKRSGVVRVLQDKPSSGVVILQEKPRGVVVVLQDNARPKACEVDVQRGAGSGQGIF